MDSILILVLALDPSAEPTAAYLAENLAGAQRTIVSATAARTTLEGVGVTIHDLSANPGIAVALTRRNPWTLVSVRELDANGTAVDTRTTIAGEVVPHTAIAPNATQARAAALRGVSDAIASSLGGAAASEDKRLAQLAQRADWAGILSSVPATAAAARPQYYRVQALARLGRREEAAQAAAALQLAHPGHILSAAAADLVPATGEVLKDDALPGDDGSNTLR